jgi:hypothetical protein
VNLPRFVPDTSAEGFDVNNEIMKEVRPHTHARTHTHTHTQTPRRTRARRGSQGLVSLANDLIKLGKYKTGSGAAALKFVKRRFVRPDWIEKLLRPKLQSPSFLALPGDVRSHAISKVAEDIRVGAKWSHPENSKVNGRKLSCLEFISGLL